MICEYVGQLIVLRCWCGIQLAVPSSLRETQMRKFNDGEQNLSIYCPLGHTFIPGGEPEHIRLERELQRERQKHDQTKAELREEKNRLNAEKAAKSRLKNRIKKGVCPCCNRHFANIQRHMETQHPDFMTSPPSA